MRKLINILMEKGSLPSPAPPCTSISFSGQRSPKGLILLQEWLQDPIWMIVDRFWHQFWSVCWLILDGFWMDFVRFLITIEKRRFYENERFAYTKQSFSWFQEMILKATIDKKLEKRMAKQKKYKNQHTFICTLTLLSKSMS